MMDEIKVYYDGGSQPCRAVLLLLRANNVPYEPVKISLSKGQISVNLVVQCNDICTQPCTLARREQH